MARERPCVILQLRIAHIRAHVLASPNLHWIFCRVSSTRMHHLGVALINLQCLSARLLLWTNLPFSILTQILAILACEELVNKVRS